MIAIDLGPQGIARSVEMGDGTISLQFFFAADSDENLGPQQGSVYGRFALELLARGIIQLLKEHPKTPEELEEEARKTIGTPQQEG